MKGIRLLFVGCLACLGFAGAWADTNDDTARAATRRSVVGATSIPSSSSATTNRQKAISSSASNTAIKTTPVRGTISATRTSAQNTGGTRAGRTTATVQSRVAENVSERTTRTGTATVSSRNVVSGREAAKTTSASRTAVARTAIGGRNTALTAQSAQSTARGATSMTARRMSRAATQGNDALAISANYKKCREIFYDCMDEFCANKDTQLKRCACSSRVNEFDSVKKQLDAVEDKMLDFNQRLLTVNMDAEDALALTQSTEGEDAFNQEDKSESKKMLDEISKKLSSSFSNSDTSQSLGAISLTLDIDSAFDSVDSMLGASDTAKTGVALYNAALPVCQEMAKEVCTDEELSLAESGYQMTIEQDCNTVAKSYATQQDNARTKIRESSALLDMSRLDIYQQRNSDDILTCKKKMLDMLTDTTVCGTDLGKCLDTTGKYIDPSTGEAVLTQNLADLGNLITRPGDNETWSGMTANQTFVTYLNSKKKYLNSAMEKCQDIADTVWNQFLDDALAQIKLAQDAKLETVRQGCTELTAQCLSDATTSIQDFDARALSIFGVSADKTVNQMCAEIRTACTSLLDGGATDDGDTWSKGVTTIASEKSYDTIIQTCREVGRSCIIRNCTSTSGNFGLCKEKNSVNRKTIIAEKNDCWQEVLGCVASASTTPNATTEENYATGDPFKEIILSAKERGLINVINDNPYKFSNIYNYKADPNDLCSTECTNSTSTTPGNNASCDICRLTERIWGNCTGKDNASTIMHNTFVSNDTLLAWFYTNTGEDSCYSAPCPDGLEIVGTGLDGAGTCVPPEEITASGYCPINSQITVYSSESSNLKNCCVGGTIEDGVCYINENNEDYNTALKKLSLKNDVVTDGYTIEPLKGDFKGLYWLENDNENQQPEDCWRFVAGYEHNSLQHYLFCVSKDFTTNPCETPTLEGTETDAAFPSGKTLKCSGYYVTIVVDVDNDKYYYVGPTGYVQTYYKDSNNNKVLYNDGATTGWAEKPETSTITGWRVAFWPK